MAAHSTEPHHPATGQPPSSRSSSQVGLSSVLSYVGLHQPSAWRNSRFRSTADAVISTIRLRRLCQQGRASDTSAGSTAGDSTNGDGSKKKHFARSPHSHWEEPTVVTRVLNAIDPSMVDHSAGAVNQLTRKGLVVVTAASTIMLHLIRLLFRDILFGKGLSDPQAILRRKVTEVYLLSSFHSAMCAVFSLQKILRGRWDDPKGCEGMLCFSLGYTTYTLVSLRGQLLKDNLFALNEGAHLIELLSCLRSRGVSWIVPTLMSAEIPLACLNALRLLAEVGVPRSSTVWQLCLGAFATSFVGIKGILLPAMLAQLVVRGAKQHPELHQPAFLPAKVACLVRIMLSYTWLGAMSTHWRPHRRSMSLDRRSAQAAMEVAPRLSELTDSFAKIGRSISVGLNPSSAYFLLVQSLYFSGPFSLPALLLALTKPATRLAGAVALAVVGAATFWPIRFEVPFSRKPVQSRSLDWIGRLLRNYFSFRTVFEARLDPKRRYLFACCPHGVMPYGVNCLQSVLRDQGIASQLVAADVVLRIPFLRQLCRLTGVIPARAEVVQDALTWGYPNNVTFIVPGGIAEIFLMRDDVEQIFLKNRKGFVKLALQAGVDLVPVYGLGHTYLFKTLDKSSTLGSILMTLSRRLKISLPLAAGRFGMPLVPLKKPVVALVGKPIRIDAPVAEPTKEQINLVHAQFVGELKRIFDKHKHLIPNYAEKRLYFEDEEVPARLVVQTPHNDTAPVDLLFPSSLPSRL